MSRVRKCFELTLVITGVLATGACTRTTVTLDSERLASVRYGSEANPFGVCVGLDGRGSGMRAWDDFLSLRGNSRLGLEGAHLAGYEASVLRGDSCHRRNLVNFQAAIWFDLSEIPEGAVVESAILNVDNTWPSEFLRGDWGSPTESAQCTVFMIGEAEEEWAGGIFFGGVSEFAASDGERPLIANRAARFDSGPHLRVASSIDVSKTVSDWVLGVRPNRGFTITPDPDRVGEIFRALTEEDHFVCQTFVRNPTLVVSYATGS